MLQKQKHALAEDVLGEERFAKSLTIDDLRFLSAACQAGAGFLWVRLVLGFFGMDLYEPYWWFTSGLALVLTGLVVRTNRVTVFSLSALERYPRTNTTAGESA